MLKFLLLFNTPNSNNSLQLPVRGYTIQEDFTAKKFAVYDLIGYGVIEWNFRILLSLINLVYINLYINLCIPIVSVRYDWKVRLEWRVNF